ncbi:MAG: GGDEF domain-containing protein [Armatimonadota bacterium]|nr:GGDEF domain-containing protein [Armatimonadota bacterium]MDR7450284.1 GGDEF domain-containing protein [Armatimonadota bacterium]MDR7467133.1 GGDEF domain-containing protein [Armatimonadota bacterium]MDR7493325.1 GGDEF domain-containing protein [Armatimonadota bacterium]MDR7499333.1 GGDEF domain-containing protein [Armatimonadota bacterium]
MKTVGQLMGSPVISVAPTETVAAAIARLRQHGIGGLPVVERGRLVGMVTIHDLLGRPPYRPVREVMSPAVGTVAPGEPVTTAYALMDAHGVDRLAVVEGNTLVGVVTRGDLLQELGKLTDPLTELPWSGSLRQHGADLLKAGREIAVLFIDLDDFGMVNKLYGHVVGDNIIKAVAALLLGRIDSETDFLCRYGGDEFAIVTTRDLESAKRLAQELRQAIAGVAVPGASPGAISGSIGVAGGKRTQERQDVHYEATVDDLITMASRASTMAKRTPQHVLQGAAPAPTAAAAPSPRIGIRRVDLHVTALRGVATVELEHRGRQVSGRAEGPVLGMGGLRLLVEATLNAVRQYLPPGWEVALEDLSRATVGGLEVLHVLLVAATPTQEERLLGSASFAADPHEAAVRATMKAVNRLLLQRMEVPA